MSFPVIDGVEVLMDPPPGYQVDFDNATKAHATIRNAYWIFGVESVLAALFLGQRLYVNAVLLRKILPDDYIIFFAWLFSIAAQSCLLYAYSHGLLGVHAWEMPLDEYNKSSLLVLTTTLNYIPTTILSKVALCFFYYRLSPSRLYQYSVYFTGFVCSASLIAIWCSVLFACKPIAAAWDARLVSSATCIHKPPVYITQAAFGCVTDLMLLVLPVPTLVGLQMSTRKKVGLVCLFGIGSVTLVTSIVRLVLLLPSLETLDQSWSLAEGCLWVIVEANLLIICGSLPTLRVFVSKVAPRILGDRSSNNASDGRKDKSDSTSFGLRTFGGSNGPKRKFDTLVELERDVHFNRSGLRPDALGENDVNVYGGTPHKDSETDSVVPETDSEEGILQTRITTVSYAPR